MITANNRARLLSSTMITGMALAAASNVYAQAAAPAAPSSEVGEIVVTGSRIPQPNLTSASPVTVVTSQELKLEGTTRVEDLINQLPQVVADQGGNLSNGASGTATINLRGLGPQRNLVLIDGTRLGPSDPGTPVADINFIPAGLIDRVDVLTGGASAVYGADAVAGVINFIMKKDFTGLEINVNGGAYEHHNGDAKSQAANVTAGYTLPDSTVFDGRTVDISLIFGANLPDGRGNVEGYLGYRHIDAVPESQRDYSNCSVSVSGKNFTCGGSFTGRAGTLLQYGPSFSNVNGGFPYNVQLFGPGGSITPFYTNGNPTAPGQYYNYAPLNYYQRTDDRYTGGFFAHYDITPHMTAYAKFMFMDDHTFAQIAESGDFGETDAIPCNDPLLSPAEVNAICVQPGYSTAANPTVGTATDDLILRRNVEGGPRISDIRHTDFRPTIGFKGDLGANWHFDVYAQYYVTQLDDIEENYLSNAKLANALDVIPNPAVGGVAGVAVGAPICAGVLNGTAPGCVPYNIFNYYPGGITPAALKYLEVPGEEQGLTREQIVSGAITGDLGAYGIKSPLAKEGVGVSFGAEYRSEYLSTEPDEELQEGDLGGSGGKTNPIAGGFNVKEVFAEARIPLANDLPFVKELTIDTGYRFSHYNEAGNTNTYKITAEWRPVDDLLFRGGFNRAVRAPNVDELFATQTVALDGNSDPCAGAVGSKTLIYSQAQCANTGVTAAQYGLVSANPAAQYNGLLGGNPNLKPETADTYTIGAVLTPTHFISGMSLSVDYFNISITNVINVFGETNILDQCALTGDAKFCDLIHRQAGTGSLWLSPTGYVVDTLQNLGSLKTNGIDFTFDYRFKFSEHGMPDFGALDLNFLGTYTMNFITQAGPGLPAVNCVGKYGDICEGSPDNGVPLPYFKAKTRLTWVTPITGLNLSVDWRYTGAVNVDSGATGSSDDHIPSYSYFDLAAQMRIKDRYTFRVGVNNIFDIQPPVIGSGELPGTVGNGNTFPQVYDALGRYIFVGVTADF